MDIQIAKQPVTRYAAMFFYLINESESLQEYFIAFKNSLLHELLPTIITPKTQNNSLKPFLTSAILYVLYECFKTEKNLIAIFFVNS